MHHFAHEFGPEMDYILLYCHWAEHVVELCSRSQMVTLNTQRSILLFHLWYANLVGSWESRHRRSRPGSYWNSPIQQIASE